MKKEVKTVGVLMSTYNGAHTLKKQVDSIMRQSNVWAEIFIRDDGSTDDTCLLIEELCKEHKGRITYIQGENLGYKKSFLSITSLIGVYDYYSFADQDDIWEENKLLNAINMLENIDDAVKLYASSVRLVDMDLKEIGFNNIQNMPNRIEALFTRGRLAGCTFVFSQKLLKLISRFSNLDYKNSQMPAHDFLTAAVAFSCGTVCLDSRSYIKHVRYKDSVTGGGNGIFKRIHIEFSGVFLKRNVYLHMAQELLKWNMDVLDLNVIPYLTNIVRYKKSLHNRIRLLANPNMNCGIKICNLETKFKILIGTY